MENLVGPLTVCSAGSVFFILAYILMRRDSLARRLRNETREMNQKMDDFNDRVRLVESHAADYMNSLGAEGSRLIAEIRTTVNSINDLLNEVGSLVATRDLGALQEATLLLKGEHPDQHTQVRKFDGTVSQRFVLPEDWDERLEALLQRAGQEVSEASMNATESGIPKRKKSESTMFDLQKARIRTRRRLFSR